jgi:hypothetical protein
MVASQSSLWLHCHHRSAASWSCCRQRPVLTTPSSSVDVYASRTSPSFATTSPQSAPPRHRSHRIPATSTSLYRPHHPSLTVISGSLDPPSRPLYTASSSCTSQPRCCPCRACDTLTTPAIFYASQASRSSTPPQISHNIVLLVVVVILKWHIGKQIIYQFLY